MIPRLGRYCKEGNATHYLAAAATVFLPGKSQAQRSLAGYSPWSPKEFGTTEQLSMHALFDITELSSSLTLRFFAPLKSTLHPHLPNQPSFVISSHVPSPSSESLTHTCHRPKSSPAALSASWFILKCHSCKAQALITSSRLDLGNSPLPDLSSSFHPAQHVKINPPRAKISSLRFLHRSLITAYNTKSSQTRSLAFPTLLCSLAADFCNHLSSPQRTPAAPIGLLLLYCTPLGMWEVLTPRERERRARRKEVLGNIPLTNLSLGASVLSLAPSSKLLCRSGLHHLLTYKQKLGV